MNTIDSAFQIKNLHSSGMFSGYGSVYDVVDGGDDVVAPGAFSESLSTWNQKGQMPALLWQHNPREPIGAYTRMNEDSKGLFVEGKLSLDVQRAKEAYALLKDKALNGLSIGFLTRDDSVDRKTGIRTIKKADLWEVSLVTFPMNDQARIGDVKSLPEFSVVSDLERFLRDVGGYSKTDAKTLTSRVIAFARRDVAHGTESSQAVVDALHRRIAVFKA